MRVRPYPSLHYRPPPLHESVPLATTPPLHESAPLAHIFGLKILNRCLENKPQLASCIIPWPVRSPLQIGLHLFLNQRNYKAKYWDSHVTKSVTNLKPYSFTRSYIFIFLSTGELDPDRMGSGIQYGDPSLRRSIRPGKQEERQKCACWSFSTSVIRVFSSNSSQWYLSLMNSKALF